VLRAWQAIQTLVALVFVAALAYGLFVLARVGWRSYTALAPEVAAAITAATATVLISVGSVIVSRIWERRQTIERELREQKIPIYRDFLNFWFRFLYHEKLGEEQPSDKELQQFFYEFTQSLMLWGSDEVVRAWSQYRRRFADGQPASPESSRESMFEFEAVLLAIRKDTGHANRGMKKGDLLGLFINDIHKFV
jgi:hypothetical protein